jgi:imidazolonepropionase-like amidohydrolase
VQAGFTTVVDMGTGRRAHENAIYAARTAVRAGQLVGPDILAVGSPISTPGNSRTSRFRADVDRAVGPQGVCSGADDCRRAVREQVARGADVINFYNTGSLLSPTSPAQTFTDEEMRAIVETAHALHRKAIADGAGKPTSAAGINAALDAGADWVDTGIYPDAGTWQRLRSSHRAYVPHLYAVTAAVGDTPTTLTEGSMGWLPDPVLQTLFSLKQQTPAAAEALRVNVPMALASDAGVFAHGRNAGELLEFVKLGMTPAQALSAGTIQAAQVLGLEVDRGSIAVGKRADLIAVEGDPLSDIRAMLKVRTVVAAGRVVKQ